MAEVISIHNSHDDKWLPYISDYIDGKLDGEQLILFERHSAECAECAAKLAEMRHTVQALHDLPMLVPPRSFTLTPAQARSLRPSPLYHLARVGAAVAAAFLVMLFALELAGTFNVTRSEVVTLVPPTPDPTVMQTVQPCTPESGGVSCFGGVPGGETNVIQPPVIKETRTVVESEVLVVRFLQIALALVVGGLAVYAYSIRPRAPDQSRR